MYRHFTLEERKYLQQLLEEGYGIRRIAKSLGRAPSSVSREINRNKSKKGYHHWQAHSLNGRLCEDSKLGMYVREKLNLYWQPECIAATWNIINPSERVGFSTIYRLWNFPSN